MAKSTEVSTKVRANEFLQTVDYSSPDGLSQALAGLDNVQSSDLVEVTSDYLNPEDGVEYNCLVTGMGEMNDSINDPDQTKGLKIKCVEGSYLKDGILTRFVNADVIIVSTFGRHFAKSQAPVLCKIVSKGKIGKAGAQYKDISIRVVAIQ
jgi:hypothetical protein